MGPALCHPGRVGCKSALQNRTVTSAASRRTAVVTGASSGMGAATARALAGEGYAVVCAARRSDRIEALAEEIDGTAVTCDVTSPESVAGLAAVVGDTLNVLVNNAGGAFGFDPVAAAGPEARGGRVDV